MNKQGWLQVLRYWDMERTRNNVLGFEKSNIFICIMAGRLGISYYLAVEKALKADKISTNGEGFKLPADTDSPFARPWTREKWSSPTYTANDRRRLWLLEQIERTP